MRRLAGKDQRDCKSGSGCSLRTVPSPHDPVPLLDLPLRVALRKRRRRTNSAGLGSPAERRPGRGAFEVVYAAKPNSGTHSSVRVLSFYRQLSEILGDFPILRDLGRSLLNRSSAARDSDISTQERTEIRRQL